MIFNVDTTSLKNHPAFANAEFMHSFIQHLRGKACHHFSYIRIMEGNKRMLLTSDPSYSELSIQKKFHRFAFFGPATDYKEGIFLTDFLNLGDARSGLSAHGIYQIIIFIKKRPHFIEHYAFGSNINDISQNHFFINNLATFEKIIQAFDSEAEPILSKYKTMPLIYPHSREHTGMANDNHLLTNTALFSKREQEILYLIKLGFSSKKIASELNASYRTIDKHIENMFIKTDAHSRIELLNLPN